MGEPTLVSDLHLTINALRNYDGDEVANPDYADVLEVGFPVRSGCIIREDGSIYHNPGNEFDVDDHTLERAIVEALLGRPLTADDKGKSFRVIIAEVEKFDPNDEV